MHITSVLLVLALIGSNQAHATPAECRPLGANSCANRIPEPWAFLPLGCNLSGPYEKTANAAFVRARNGDYGAKCNLTASALGWGLTGGAPNCGGGGSYLPSTAGGGIEVQSYQSIVYPMWAGTSKIRRSED